VIRRKQRGHSKKTMHSALTTKTMMMVKTTRKRTPRNVPIKAGSRTPVMGGEGLIVEVIGAEK